MGSKHSRPSSPHWTFGKAHARASSPQQDDISEVVRTEFSVDDIHNPENTRRAQALRLDNYDRFCKYRNYFKNHHMSLAREVSRKTSKSKAELLAWVEATVGPLEDGMNLTKDEILEVAMVSAAISEYGELSLANLYDKGELDALPNVPLHTHNLRLPAKQQACRDNSEALNKNELEAAHYIGLEVMLRLNERLPVEQRMGEELREILNHPSNLRLVLATNNQVLHKKVDALLINLFENNDTPQRKISAREYDRLVQIAKHAQNEGFQEAMIAANGHYLYASLREQFNRLDVGDRTKLWNIDIDKDELRHPPRPRFRSPSPAPQQPRSPPSPRMKEAPTRSRDSSKDKNSYFSRFARKIFRSHSSKKKNTAQAPSTMTSEANDTAHLENAKVFVHRPRAKKTVAKNHPKGNKGHPRHRKKGKEKADSHSNQVFPSEDDESNGGSNISMPKKTSQNYRSKIQPRRRRSKHHSNQENLSEDDDSDYVDEKSDQDSDDSDNIDERSDQDSEDSRVLHVGPRGGKYYINTAGKKVYIK